VNFMCSAQSKELSREPGRQNQLVSVRPRGDTRASASACQRSPCRAEHTSTSRSPISTPLSSRAPRYWPGGGNGGKVGIEHIGDTFPLAIRLFLPDIDILAAVLDLVALGIGVVHLMPQKLFDSRVRYGVKARAGVEPGCPVVAEDGSDGAACSAGGFILYAMRPRFNIPKEYVMALSAGVRLNGTKVTAGGGAGREGRTGGGGSSGPVPGP
jgi:hypothetical protein